MKNIKFLSLICLLCIVFSLFTPVLAVNFDPDEPTVTETPAESASAPRSSI